MNKVNEKGRNEKNIKTDINEHQAKKVIKGRKIVKKANQKKSIRFSNLEETVVIEALNLPKSERTKKKKRNLVPLFATLGVVLLVGGVVTSYFLIFKEDKISFKINGEKEITLDVFKKYKEPGFKLIVNKKNMTNSIKIKGKVKTDKIGSYEIKYLFENKILGKRKIIVEDKKAPKLTLNGEKEIVLLETAEYKEQGAVVEDNYDTNLEVKIEGEVKTDKVGEYTIKYLAVDSSKNQSELERKVIVEEKPKEIIKTVAKQEVDKPPVINTVNVAGQLKNMTFTNNGIKIEGCANTGEYPSGVSIGEYNFQLNVNNNCYSGEVNLSNLANGTYPIKVIVAEDKKDIINKLSQEARILRGRVGNKLATFSYDNSNITVTISNFFYEYDVLIDVGHGGYDSGAVNNYIKEKDMNLAVSLYEKSLFEAKGYRVLLTREGDTYGSGMGPSGWPALRKRSYYMGYYGATSKVMYSNHHNSSASAKARGFQMYVSTKMTNMQTELNIYNQVGGVFKTSGIYTRDYWTGNLYSKAGGQFYNLTNYYAVLRIPADLFNNNHVTIYEGSFLSSPDDHIEYWLNEKWKKISEIKVNNYINKLQSM